MVEIKEYDGLQDNVKVNPEGFDFEITCKKCKSANIRIEANNNIMMSDAEEEYIGLEGNAKVIIECKDCRNTYAFTIADY